MGEIINLSDFTKKSNNKEQKKPKDNFNFPKIYVVKENDKQYNVLVKADGNISLFNKVPITNLAVAVYVASCCKDQLSEYMNKNLTTDIILFDEKCTEEMKLV